MPVLWKPSRVESLLHRSLLESLLNEQAFVVLALVILDFNSIEPNGVRLKLEHGSSPTRIERKALQKCRAFSFFRASKFIT